MMNKKLKYAILIIAGILIAGDGVLIVSSVLSHRKAVASAVSIIGTADGPTSIFLAGKIGGPETILLLGGVMAVLLAVFILIIRLKEK